MVGTAPTASWRGTARAHSTNVHNGPQSHSLHAKQKSLSAHRSLASNSVLGKRNSWSNAPVRTCLRLGRNGSSQLLSRKVLCQVAALGRSTTLFLGSQSSTHIFPTLHLPALFFSSSKFYAVNLQTQTQNQTQTQTGRFSSLRVAALWGRRGKQKELETRDENSPGPPDARNLGKLSKVLPFSVYELQRLEFGRDLKEGDYGADVEALQRAMHTFGHMPKDSQITGYYGRATFVAVREWQRSQGLPGTGFWGPMSQETFADVVQRHAAAQEALVTLEASPTQALAKTVTATVTAAVPTALPQSRVGRVGFALGGALICAGILVAVLRLTGGLREADVGLEEGLENEVSEGFASVDERIGWNGVPYQGRWGRPETEERLPRGYYADHGLNPESGINGEFGADGRSSDGSEPAAGETALGGLLEKVGDVMSEGLGRFWNGGANGERSELTPEESNRLGVGGMASPSGRLAWEEPGVESDRYDGVLDYRPVFGDMSPEQEIAQLQTSVEALVRELSSVEVQRQAALKALDEERQRTMQLESLLDHKVQAIGALQAEVKSLKAAQRSQLTASHRD